MGVFEPDYENIVQAARNVAAERLPLYEHGFATNVVEAITGQEVAPLLGGDHADRVEGFRRICAFAVDHGYDVVPFEHGATQVIQGGLALKGQAGALFATLDDIRAYPWDEKLEEYLPRAEARFSALAEALPPGMKAVGGVGNGPMECAQDFVPFEQLALLSATDPEAYAELWRRIGDLLVELWTWFLDRHADAYAVCRMGDDLGFQSSTLLSPGDIRMHIVPVYRRVIDLVHARGKPFLLHSCGRIHAVMDDLIGAGIDAKHSNEDNIDPFAVWLERYGDRIGNFGGVDMNVLCLRGENEIRDYTLEVLRQCEGHGGVAIGSGNQIATYVPPEGFEAMVRTVREYRGE